MANTFGRVIVAMVVAAASAAWAGPPTEPTVGPGQKRSDKALAGGPLRHWPERADQADVLAATFIGGKGHEWLAAGGFQPDGTVVLCGNVAGGVFDIVAAETVIGTDGTRPAPANLGKVMQGKTQVDEKPGWLRTDATGFVARMTSDLKQIVGVSRLPWTSAVITTCEVAPDGAIYIAGRVNGNIAAMGGQQAELTVSPESARKGKAECDHTFIAKLDATGKKALWVRTSKGPSDSPKLSLGMGGQIVYAAQQLWTLDASGKQVATMVVPGGVTGGTSVSPVDGNIVRGGEHNWPTGREPWRCPVLNTFLPNGTQQYELFHWPGPYVVLDNCRLVSDTAVRMVSHDREGNILVVLWSDGGNSVALCQPTDIRRGVGTRGLGLTTAGANATSFAYLLKIDPKTMQTTAATLWCSQYGGKANGASITSLGQSVDGSFLYAGGSAWGLIQTGNKISNGEPAGQYIAVATKDLTGMRFCSSIPGAGAADISSGRGEWGVSSGMVNGKPRALFVCGATNESDVYGLVSPTPTLNALQDKFGGGASDGYVVMVDLSKGAAPSTTPAAAPSGPPARMSILREARNKGGKPGKNDSAPPAAGTVYHLRPEYPRFSTVDIEFRDAKGAYWPSFAYGKPVSGELKWSSDQVDGTAVVECPAWCQPTGDQSRRVMGQFVTAGKGEKLTFTLKSFDIIHTEDVKVHDNKGQEVTRELSSCVAKGTLQIGGKSMDVSPKCVIKQGRIVESSTEKLSITAYFTFKGSALGMTGPLANEEIDARITFQAQAGDVPVKGGKKK